MVKPEEPNESSTLAPHIATELLWWVGWFALSFVVGWDITNQLTSPWFWLVAALLCVDSVRRWRRSQTRPVATGAVGGHHDVAATHVSGRRTQRGMLIYFVVALGVLIVASSSVGPEVADGRSILLGEEISDSEWSTGPKALRQSTLRSSAWRSTTTPC